MCCVALHPVGPLMLWWHRHSCLWWDRRSCLSLLRGSSAASGDRNVPARPHITGKNAYATVRDASAEADPTRNDPDFHAYFAGSILIVCFTGWKDLAISSPIALSRLTPAWAMRSSDASSSGAACFATSL